MVGDFLESYLHRILSVVVFFSCAFGHRKAADLIAFELALYKDFHVQ